MEQTENTEGTAILGDGQASTPVAGVGELSCPYCGATIPAGERFCLECGFERGSLSEESAVELEPKDGVLEILIEEERFVLAEGEHVLGRSEGELVVSNPYLSRRHMKLRVSEGRLFVTDLGSTNGTFVDGKRLAADEESEVSPGALLKAGELELKLNWLIPLAGSTAAAESTLEEPADAEAAMKEEEIVEAEVDTGEEGEPELAEVASNWQLIRGGEVFPLPFGEIRVGRKLERNDIAFPEDGYISGEHLLFESDLDYLKVKDRGSTNGTFVGGRRIEPDTWVELTPGTEIRIGQTQLIVERSAPPVEAVPQAEEPSADVSEEEPETQTDLATGE